MGVYHVINRAESAAPDVFSISVLQGASQRRKERPRLARRLHAARDACRDIFIRDCRALNEALDLAAAKEMPMAPRMTRLEDQRSLAVVEGEGEASPNDSGTSSAEELPEEEKWREDANWRSFFDNRRRSAGKGGGEAGGELRELAEDLTDTSESGLSSETESEEGKGALKEREGTEAGGSELGLEVAGGARGGQRGSGEKGQRDSIGGHTGVSADSEGTGAGRRAQEGASGKAEGEGGQSVRERDWSEEGESSGLETKGRRRRKKQDREDVKVEDSSDIGGEGASAHGRGDGGQQAGGSQAGGEASERMVGGEKDGDAIDESVEKILSWLWYAGTDEVRARDWTTGAMGSKACRFCAVRLNAAFVNAIAHRAVCGATFPPLWHACSCSSFLFSHWFVTRLLAHLKATRRRL